MSDIFNALSHTARREILGLLKHGALSAGEIAEQLAISKPTLSGHLNVLKAAELVTVERRGASLIYRVNLSVLEEGLASILDLFAIGSDALKERRLHKRGAPTKGKAK